MTRVDLKGWFPTYKTRRNGERVVYRYHRATMKPLHGEPGSPEFIADFAAAEKFQRDRLVGTFNGLVRDYTLSPEFAKLADSTKREYRRMLTKAEAQFGDMPIAAMEDPRVRRDFLDWRVKVAKGSGEREADNRLSAISAMLTWARENGRTRGQSSSRLQAAVFVRSFGQDLVARERRGFHARCTDRDAARSHSRAAYGAAARRHSPACLAELRWCCLDVETGQSEAQWQARPDCHDPMHGGAAAYAGRHTARGGCDSHDKDRTAMD